MSFVGAWVKENVGVYVRNAATVRDYRVQLRGNRSIILWAVYLSVLIGFGLLTYSAAAEQGHMSVVQAQMRLEQFYHQIIGLLATVIALVAPALTATAIVAEKQRKSLDLVFSAPVSPKYYLVGKMLSSYRYIWMLLVLSLPVTAACVVLGGAVWSEVLASYGLMSLHGLIYTSIALLFSTLAQKPVGAIVWSYIGVFAYAMLISLVAEPLAARSAMAGMFGGQVTNEMPFVVTLSPFSVFRVASTFTNIAGYHVPNWLLAGLFTLFLVKLMLLGAGSALSTYGSSETKSLRIHGLIYTFLISLGLAWAIGSTMVAVAPMIAGLGRPTAAPTLYYDLYFSRLFLAVILPLLIVLPFLTCYGTDLEKKFWPDGLFSLRKMWIATPAGGLPYLLALMACAAGGVFIYGVFWFPQLCTVRFGEYVFFGFALFFASWSVGRLTSAMNNGLRSARTLQFTVLILLLGLPLPFLFIADPFGFSSTTPSIWDVYILRPLFGTGDKSTLAATFGTVLIVVGLIITRWSESLAKARYEQVGLSYGRTS